MEKDILFLRELTLQEKQKLNGGLSEVTEAVLEFLGEMFMTPFVIATNVKEYAGPVLDK